MGQPRPGEGPDPHWEQGLPQPTQGTKSRPAMLLGLHVLHFLCPQGPHEQVWPWGQGSGPPHLPRVLLAVGQAAVLAHCHGFLLDVVLREKARLARHHLLDGRRDHHVIYVVVRLPRLPLLRGDDLQDQDGSQWLPQSLRAGSESRPCRRLPRDRHPQICTSGHPPGHQESPCCLIKLPRRLCSQQGLHLLGQSHPPGLGSWV